MSFDLAIAPNGDLIVSAAKDLQGATGTAIIEQRIGLRLRLIRGSWMYDDRGSMGSNIQELFGSAPEIAATRVEPLVREALRTMEDEIEINQVVASPGEKDITVTVAYRLLYTDETSGVTDVSDIQTVGIIIPLAD